MRNISANAILNLNEAAPTLYVFGLITTGCSEDKIVLKKAESDEINNSILVLDLEVINGTGPMKEILKSFNYETSDNNIKKYRQVTIRYGIDASITINTEILGQLSIK